jgi:hypothetical protein
MAIRSDHYSIALNVSLPDEAVSAEAMVLPN